MKIKNKGKVHPSPSSSSSSASASDGVVLSVLQLLPAAILALASVLSLDDREVLAYMITRSMKTSPTSSSFANSQDSSKKRSSKKLSNKTKSESNYNHEFDCECFDCYRSYWFRWDSSPNRELIHQAIEAFEDHLAHGEKPKKSAGRGKRREKMGRREAQKPAEGSSKDEVFAAAAAAEEDKVVNVAVSSLVPEVVLPPPLCEVVSVERVEEEVKEVEVAAAAEDEVALVVRAAAVSNHKGLARKVLPDVLGLFNSRLWNLWSPNA